MKLRAAVYGVGHLGRHHARILSTMEGVELVAVVDPNEERGRAAAERCSTVWTPDGVGLEGKVDFAVVAVPTTSHRDVAGPLLRAGVACLIEKPMAVDVQTCRLILEDAAAGKALVGVGHVERFNPAVVRARERGIEPRFIEAHRLAPYSFRSTDVGVVLDLMIHDIDLASSWIGRELESVDAVGGETLSASEDIVSARLRFEGGAVANLTASRLSLKPMRRFRVFGPDSYLSIDSKNRYALLVRKTSNFSPESMEAAAASDDPMAGFQGLLDIEELQIEEDEPLRAELEAFAEAVRDGGPVPVCGEDGLRAVAIAERVLAAVAECSWESDR